MEVPVINRLSDFEAGVNSLNNPSFFSQIIALSGVEKAYHAYSFWQWGALIIAIIATFSAVIRRIKILVLNFWRYCYPASKPLLGQIDEDDDCDSLTTDDSFSSEEDDDSDDECVSSSSWASWRPVDEDFSVRGSAHCVDDQLQNRNLKLRRRRGSVGDLFSWSDFASGKSVVKLWDNLGLGFGLSLDLEEASSGDVVSVYDINKELRIASISSGNYGVPAIATPSSAVVVSAGTTGSRNVALRFWDTRVGCRSPAMLAEWRPKLGKIIGINAGGVEKVYVRDDVTGALTVGDTRKVSSPLENFTESDVDTWWDADAVIVSDEFVDESS